MTSRPWVIYMGETYEIFVLYLNLACRSSVYMDGTGDSLRSLCAVAGRASPEAAADDARRETRIRSPATQDESPETPDPRPVTRDATVCLTHSGRMRQSATVCHSRTPRNATVCNRMPQFWKNGVARRRPQPDETRHSTGRSRVSGLGSRVLCVVGGPRSPRTRDPRPASRDHISCYKRPGIV